MAGLSPECLNANSQWLQQSNRSGIDEMPDDIKRAGRVKTATLSFDSHGASKKSHFLLVRISRKSNTHHCIKVYTCHMLTICEKSKTVHIAQYIEDGGGY